MNLIKLAERVPELVFAFDRFIFALDEAEDLDEETRQYLYANIKIELGNKLLG